MIIQSSNKIGLVKAVLALIIMIAANTSPMYVFASGLHTVDYNYINDFIGGRATSMGGAYTAISDDPSGAYYNPAGIVFAYDNQISLSVNSYKQKDIQMNDAVGNNPYTQESAAFYPSFFGIIQSLGPLKIAGSLMTVNNEILDQDDYYEGIYAQAEDGNVYPADFRINYNITDNTLIGGLSLAGFFTDYFSWGVTAYGLWRRSQQIANLMVRFQKQPTEITYQHVNTYITESMSGALLKFGLQFMPFDTFSIGYAFTYGSVMKHSFDSQQFIKQEDGAGNMLEDNNYYMDVSSVNYTDSKLPMNHRLGFAFFPNNSLTLSADIIADIGNKYYQNDVENTINYAIGAEYYLLRTLPVSIGLFTNFANTSKVGEGYINQEMHVDLYGVSGGLSWETKSSSITLCGFYQYGKGKSQVIGNSTAIQDTTVQIMSISLTGSAKY